MSRERIRSGGATGGVQRVGSTARALRAGRRATFVVASALASVAPAVASGLTLGAAGLATGCAASGAPPDVPADVGPASRAPARPGDAGPTPGSTAPVDEPGGRPPAGPALGALRHVWTAETGGWSSALLLAPEGDLLSFAARNLRVHARDDGRVLHATTSCGPVSEDAVAWLDAGRFAVVCGEEVRVFTWPGLGSSRLVALKARVDQAAIGGGVIAVAEDGFFAPDRKGRLLVLSAKDGKVLDEVAPPAEVQSLAVSPDGTSVVFATDDAVLVRDVRARTTRPLREARLAKGFSFSPDGRSLFGRFESFDASVVDPASGEGRGAGWEVGSWITAARWLDARTVVATGSDGLAVFPLGQPKIPSPVADLGEGLAAAADGSVVCAAGRSGRVSCFARSAPGPTTLADSFPNRPPRAVGDAAGSAPGPDAPDAAIDGKLVSRQGKTLVVQVDPAAGVKVGATGEMSRSFQQDLGFVVSGWIVVAEVKVVAVDRGRVSLALIAEKSAMTMNGRPVNHFTPGEVRLSLLAPP